MFLDILFIITLLLLFFLPKKIERYKYYKIFLYLVLILNIGIRVHLIKQKNKLSIKINNLERQDALKNKKIDNLYVKLNVIKSTSIDVKIKIPTIKKKARPHLKKQNKPNQFFQGICSLHSKNNDDYHVFILKNWTEIQTSESVKMLELYFPEPYYPGKLYGNTLDYFKTLSRFNFDFTPLLKIYKSEINQNLKISIYFKIIVNGFEVVNETFTESYSGELLSRNVVVEIEEQLQEISNKIIIKTK